MKSKAQKRVVIIIGIGLLVVALGSIGQLRPLRNALGVVASPIVRVFHGFGSGLAGNLGVVGSARNLARDNARLEQENADLRAALAVAAEQQAELAAIKKELSINAVTGGKLIPADVISSQPDSYRAFVTISRGSGDGVRVGMVVLSEGRLVGTISEVTTTTAKVFVVTDPEFRVAAQVLGSGGTATGIVRGGLGGGLIMEKIPQDQAIKAGDSVITSGLGGSIIKGYSLGTVRSVTRQDNGVFQTATLTNTVQISKLQTVFVVAK